MQSILARFEGVRGRDNCWKARCPSHNDSSPSLAIREVGNCVLMHCFAGCDIQSICRAVGLEVADLFKVPLPQSTSKKQRHRRSRVTREVVASAIISEIQQYQQEHGLVDQRLLTSEINSIRRSVSLQIRVNLPPLSVELEDAHFMGRERDSAWPAIFERAIFCASVELLSEPIDYKSGDTEVPPAVLIRAEEIAAENMRDLERAASERIKVGTVE